MALASPATAFTRYVEKHPDLKKAFTDSGAKSIASWGEKHWTKHGRKSAGRTSPHSLRSSTTGTKLGEAAATKNKAISDADYSSGTRIGSKSTASTEPKLIEEGSVGPNDSWNAVNFSQASGNNTGLHEQGATYSWRVTGPFEHKKKTGGLLGSSEKKRFRMDMNGQTGWAMVLNLEETDKTKWEFAWTPQNNVGGGDTNRWNHMEGLPDVYIGKLYEEAEAEPTTDEPVVDEPVVDPNAGQVDGIDSSTADILSTFAGKTSANDPLALSDNSGYSSTVLTSGVQEETEPSVLTPTSAGPDTAYDGSTAMAAGLQVVDPLTGKVYANKAAATAAGITTWMYKTEWDAKYPDSVAA
jgi:hypothetical protein